MKHFFIIMTVLGSMLFICAIAGAGNTKPAATKMAYFDTATGHKYIKNSDATYSEYSKKGKLLRSDVPNTLPLLVSSKYIVEIQQDNFIVYEQSWGKNFHQKILQADMPHPEGWKSTRIMSAYPPTSEAEAYTSPE